MSMQVRSTKSRTAATRTHLEHCFAGQPAACPGYFAGDVLPCVCGVEGSVLQALSRIAIPVFPHSKDEPSRSHAMPLIA
jgi:hypothetical protein